jgi:hypothetical protein
VKLFTNVAEAVGKHLFYEHMNVLAGHIELEFACV